MFDRLRCLALVAVACVLPLAPIHAQQLTKDIPYTTGPEGPELGDLYEPTGPGPFPAIVYIHGGSWRTGNKKIYQKLATDLASNGYAGFSINYDLHSHSFPTPVEEARSAVRFLRKHAADYRIDPHQIVVAGDSAGGEIAALVALTSDDTSADVSAAIIFNGVYRLTTNYFVIARYLGVKCQAQPAVCKDASPFQQIHPGAPPFFIGHGNADGTVPYSEAEGFIQALREQHISVSTYVADGGHHSYWKKPAFYEPNLKAAETFLAATLHPTEPTP